MMAQGTAELLRAVPQASSAHGPWAGSAKLSWRIPRLHGPCPACSHILISDLWGLLALSRAQGVGKLIFVLLAAFRRPCSAEIWMPCVTLYQYDAGSCHFTANTAQNCKYIQGKCQQTPWGFGTTSGRLTLWKASWFCRWSTERAFSSAGFIAESWCSPNSEGQKLSNRGHLDPLLPDRAC